MLQIYQGDSIDLIFPVKDTDGDFVLDLALATAVKFMVKEEKSDADVDALISKALLSGIVVDVPTKGFITVSLTRTDTLNIVGLKYFGLQIEWAPDSVKELFCKYNGETIDRIEFLKGVID